MLGGIQTFEEIPAQQWEELAHEARVTVESKPLDANTLWRNPDVAKSGGGLKVKKSQMAFPKQLAGVPLSPSSRDGKRYCVDFQCGECQESGPCRLGIHKCAAVFRSGRTCHGSHPGSECRNTKKHAIPEEANPEGRPARKGRRTKGSEERVPANEVSRPNYVMDDSIMKRMLPELSLERYVVRGHRLDPEPPRLAAKV